MEESPMEGTPMPLASVDADGKLEFNEDTLKMVGTCNIKLRVVSIVGPYRSGKSTLMNLLLKLKLRQGFDVGHTVQGTTKGIWAMLVDNPTREDEKLLLLDTEGTSDAEKANTSAENICVLFALLVSDIVIVNVKSNIDEKILETLGALGIIAGLATTEGEKYFPELVVVVRDFHLDLTIDGKRCSSDEYLEHMLKDKEGNAQITLEHNKVRNVIKKNFKKYQCITLPAPCRPRDVRTLATMPDAELEPEFIEQTQSLKEIAFHSDITGITAQVFADRVEQHLPFLRTTMCNIDLQTIIRALMIKRVIKIFTASFNEKWLKVDGVKDEEVPLKFAEIVWEAKEIAKDEYLSICSDEEQLDTALQKHIEHKIAPDINETSYQILSQHLEETFGALSESKEGLQTYCDQILAGTAEAERRLKARMVPEGDNANLIARFQKRVKDIQKSSWQKLPPHSKFVFHAKGSVEDIEAKWNTFSKKEKVGLSIGGVSAIVVLTAVGVITGGVAAFGATSVAGVIGGTAVAAGGTVTGAAATVATAYHMNKEISRSDNVEEREGEEEAENEEAEVLLID